MEYETDKWYGWDGGECPVHPETVVEGVYWDNENDRIHNLSPVIDPAADFDWKMEYRNTLLAFRVITPYVEPPKPREFWISTATRKAYRFLSSLRMEEGDYADYIKVTEDLK